MILYKTHIHGERESVFDKCTHPDLTDLYHSTYSIYI